MIMCFTAVVSLYLMRVCLAISMTQMVKPIVANASAVHESDELSCPVLRINRDHQLDNETEVAVENLKVIYANL